jgi:hypothetical protein
MLAGLGAVLIAVGVVAKPTRGVKDIDFDPRPTICHGVPGVSCLHDAGSGLSNKIYVRQNKVDGQLRYNEVFGTGEDGDVWFQTTVGGECASNHRLRSLKIHLGFIGDDGSSFVEPEEEPGEVFPVNLPVDHDHKTVPTRNVAIHVPVDLVLKMVGGGKHVDVEEWGEQRIADLVADGESEANARTAPHRHSVQMGMHAELHCRRRTNHGATPNAWDSEFHPVEIVWLGEDMEPGEEDSEEWRDALIPETPHAPPAIDPNLSLGFQVTDATLTAVEDGSDPCRLHLSGSVTTTELGRVEYRFADEFGQTSQTFTVDVDQTLTGFFDNVVELEPIVLEPSPSDAPPDAFAAVDDGEIGGFTQEDGDRIRGYYQLEVVEPHEKRSEVASYNIDGCVVVDHGDGSFTNPTAPAGPPTDLSTTPNTVPPVPLPPPGDLANPHPNPRPAPVFVLDQ